MNGKTENQRTSGGFAAFVAWVVGGTAVGLVEMYVISARPAVSFSGHSLPGFMMYYWIPFTLGGILVWAGISVASRISGRSLNGLAWGCGLFVTLTTFIYAGYWVNTSISGSAFKWPAVAVNLIVVLVAVLSGFFIARAARSIERGLAGNRVLQVVFCVVIAAPLIYLAWSWGNVRWDQQAAIARGPDVEHAPGAAQGAAEGGTPPNVVLITVDALRADHLSINGYERNTSPYLDRLAREGANFSQAFSQATITVRSMASLFTSLYPQMHGLMDYGIQLSDSVLTLPEVLAEMGYSTAGFGAGNPSLFQTGGIVKGYDYYDDCNTKMGLVPQDVLSKLGLLTRIAPRLDLTRCPRAETVLEKARSWLRSGPTEPFFLFIHLMDVHSPYLPPKPFDSLFDRRIQGTPTDESLNELLNTVRLGMNTLFFELVESGEFHRMNELDLSLEEFGEDNLKRLIDLYDGEIAYTDSQLEAFIEELEAAGTLLMITADHGEGFLDHGRVFHSGDMVYDELTRVPLIMKYPGIITAGTRIDSPVRLIDIMPTVLETAGGTAGLHSRAPQHLELEGRSLLPLLQGDKEELALRDRGDVYSEGAFVSCVRTARWKYIDNEGHNTRELYDLAADPRETENLVVQMEEQTRQLAAILEGYAERVRLYQQRHPRPTSIYVDEATRRKLKSLGYVQ